MSRSFVQPSGERVLKKKTGDHKWIMNNGFDVRGRSTGETSREETRNLLSPLCVSWDKATGETHFVSIFSSIDRVCSQDKRIGNDQTLSSTD